MVIINKEQVLKIQECVESGKVNKKAPKMPDGTVGYPETVYFRLIDSKGGPNVKIVATEDGSGFVLGGDSGFVQILSRTADPTLKLRNKKGNEKIIGIE